MTASSTNPAATVSGRSSVQFDLYRDVHKGIRAELLHAHARHEDLVRPALEAHLPDLAAQIDTEHQIYLTHQDVEEAVMLPAMNIDDRSELRAGMRATAPAEAFDAAWNLAGSVLPASDHTALATRLGLT